MEDKDLDTYFKDRSGSFNEPPGEGLWAKIEANIEPPAQNGFKAGKWLLPGAGMVVVAGLVAAWFATRNTTETPTPTEQQPQVVTVITDPVAPVVNTSVSIVKDTISPTAKAAVINAAANQSETKELTPAITDAVQADEFIGEVDEQKADAVINASAHANNTLIPKDTIAAPQRKSIPYNFDFDKNKDVMEISITQKITRAERNSLIKNTIEGNAKYVGRKIIIKAKGYRIYRHTINQADYKMYAISNKDTLKTSPSLKLEVVTDTVLYGLKQDSITPASIKFEIKKAVKKE